MFVFDNGVGRVICDRCRAMIDENLSDQEYNDYYGPFQNLCDSCMNKPSRNAKPKRYDEPDPSV